MRKMCGTLSVCAGVGGAVVAGCACAAPAAFQNAVAADTPALWWQFNESGGTMAVNHGSLGAAFDGTYFNGVTLGAATIGGDAGASFNLTQQQYVESLGAAPAAFIGNPSFSVETLALVTATTGSIYAPFLHWGSGATGKEVYFSLWRGSPSRLFAGFYNAGVRTLTSGTTDRFFHYVWVRDAAGGASDEYMGHTLYVNGRCVSFEPDTTLPGTNTIDVTSTTFRVQKARDFTRFFTGTMDELALYSTLLTREDVEVRAAALGLDDCAGDVDFDRDVDFADLNFLLTQFNQVGGCYQADLNGDDAVNFADLNLVLSAFNSACP